MNKDTKSRAKVTLESIDYRIVSLSAKIDTIEKSVKELPTRTEMHIAIDNAVEELALATAKGFEEVHADIRGLSQRIDRKPKIRF